MYKQNVNKDPMWANKFHDRCITEFDERIKSPFYHLQIAALVPEIFKG